MTNRRSHSCEGAVIGSHCWHQASGEEIQRAEVNAAKNHDDHLVFRREDLRMYACCRSGCAYAESKVMPVHRQDELLAWLEQVGDPGHCQRSLVVTEKDEDWRDVCADAIRERRDGEAFMLMITSGLEIVGYLNALARVANIAEVMMENIVVHHTRARSSTGVGVVVPTVVFKDHAKATHQRAELLDALSSSREGDGPFGTAQARVINAALVVAEHWVTQDGINAALIDQLADAVGALQKPSGDASGARVRDG